MTRVTTRGASRLTARRSARGRVGIAARALALATLLLPTALSAQVAATDSGVGSPVRRVVAWSALTASLRDSLTALRARGDLGPIALVDSVWSGGGRITATDTVRGSVVAVGGTLTVDGLVDGSVAVVGGSLVVGPAAVITGGASAVGGSVRNAGTIAGQLRSTIASAPPAGAAAPVAPATGRPLESAPRAATPAERTWRAVKLVAACFALFVILGVGVLVFSQGTLDGVAAVLGDRFGRSFGVGLVAQFAILPILLVVVVALAISVVGILLIPFAVVAYLVAVAGLLALGFLAAVRVSGGAFGPGDGSVRSAHLRGLTAGLLLHFGLWMVAAGLSWHPLAGTLARVVALAVTWAATTVGLGAIITAGLAARRARAQAHLPRPRTDAALGWQTPTPITGVVAARRPVPVRREA